MNKFTRWLDAASLLVVLVTLVLFALALASKGFTHDLLLEAGVFLVSAKLVIASYQNREAAMRQMARLDRIEILLREQSIGSRGNPTARP